MEHPEIERRRAVLERWIDVDAGEGLEFGPLDRPLVPAAPARAIAYVDHASTEDLRRKYAGHPGRDLDRIVDIDYVLGDRPLGDVVDRSFDYVVASHVIEHVPNLAAWLRGLDGVLKPGGRVFLAVPDKRFTFDAHRPLTSVGDVLECFRANKTRPSFRDAFDQHFYHAQVNSADVWDAGPQSAEQAPRTFSLQQAREIAERTRLHYIDCHCSVFTAQSFAPLISALEQLDLQPFAVARFQEPERPFNDFLCTLERHRA